MAAIEFLNFELFDHIRVFKYLAFCSICSVNGPLDREKFEIEREIVARDQEFCSRQRKIREREVRDKEIKIAYIVHKCPRDRAFRSK